MNEKNGKENFLKHIMHYKMITVPDNNIKHSSLLDDVKDFFERALRSLFEEHENRVNVICFMVRKAWCLYKTIWPLIENRFAEDEREEIRKRTTNDAMLIPWMLDYAYTKSLNSLNDVKVAIVDDTIVKGNAIRQCVEKLCGTLEMPPKNVFFYAFAVEDYKDENHNSIKHFEDDYSILRVRKTDNSDVTKDSEVYKINFCKDAICKTVTISENYPFCKSVTVRSLSRVFLEAFHVSSVPYHSFTSSFIIPFEYANEYLGPLEERVGGFIQQADLKPPFNDKSMFEFHNFSSRPMFDNNVEAFLLCPLEESLCSWGKFPFPEPKLQTNGIRFYVNRNEEEYKLIAVPYVPIPNITKRDDVVFEDFCDILFKCFPDKHEISDKIKIRHLMELPRDAKGKIKFPKKQGNRKKLLIGGCLTAYKLLSRAAGHGFGMAFFKEHFSKMPIEWDKKQGLNIADYEDWINGKKYSKPENSGKDFENEIKEVWSSAKIPIESEPKFIKNKAKNKQYFKDEFARFFDGNLNFYHAAGDMFNEFLRKDDFYGLPLRIFKKSLFDKLKRDGLTHTPGSLMAIQFYVHDSGEAAVFPKYEMRSNTTAPYLVAGEQSCHASYNASPFHAFFLQRFKEGLSDDKKAKLLNDNFERIIERLNEHFDEINIKYPLQFSRSHILQPLYHIRECSKRKFMPIKYTDEKQSVLKVMHPYCAPPYPRGLDVSEEFLLGLMREYELISAEEV